MDELALFAGSGGGILGGELLEWNTIGAVEIEEYPRKVLLQRQRDGILEPFPIWDDITTFDGRPWKGAVDIVSGGFPCQDISAAGKGAGIDGERSGLWGEMARVINEVRPRFAFVENSPMLTIRGLGRVLGDLSEMGYNARWCVLGADDVGAPHRRKRIWILAYADKMRKLQSERNEQKQRGRIGNSSQNVGHTLSPGLEGFTRNESDRDKPGRIGETENGSIGPAGIRWWDTDPAEMANSENTNRWRTNGTEDSRRGIEKTGRSDINRIWEEYRTIESIMGRVAHGVAHRVDRLKAIGNGQVPASMALAFLTLSEGLI